MRRRGFFGTLAGLALAPFGVKAAKPITYKGVPIVYVPRMNMHEDLQEPEPVYVSWSREGTTWWVGSQDEEIHADLAKAGYVRSDRPMPLEPWQC